MFGLKYGSLCQNDLDNWVKVSKSLQTFHHASMLYLGRFVKNPLPQVLKISYCHLMLRPKPAWSASKPICPLPLNNMTRVENISRLAALNFTNLTPASAIWMQKYHRGSDIDIALYNHKTFNKGTCSSKRKQGGFSYMLCVSLMFDM